MFKLHYGDMTDSSCLVKIIAEVRPTEIYNLAAQSHVKVFIGQKSRSLIVEFAPKIYNSFFLVFQLPKVY